MAVFALGLAIMGAASMVYYEFGLFVPRLQAIHAAKHLAGKYVFADDFYPVWLTTREWIKERRDPYSPVVTHDIQIGLFGRPLEGQFPTDPPAEYRTFAYPAYTDLLFWPTSTVRFRTLSVAWVALLATLLAAAVFLWTRAFSWQVGGVWLGIAVLLTVCSYPELEGLYDGQLGILVGFLLAGSLWALQRGRTLLAGLLMALTTIKPQMTLLAVLYLIIWSLHDWRQRGRFSMAFLASMLLLLGASLAAWPHWLQSWIGVVFGYRRYTTPPLLSQLLGLGSGPSSNAMPIVVALVAALALGWLGRAAPLGSHKFWLTLSFLLALTTITVIAGQSLCDHVILLPGILLLARSEQERRSSRIFRALLAIGVGLLLWPWFAALGLAVLRPLLSPDFLYSKAVFILPIRTASTFPFMVVILLALALRKQWRGSEELVSFSAPQR
jgi:hypothetical protein